MQLPVQLLGSTIYFVNPIYFLTVTTGSYILITLDFLVPKVIPRNPVTLYRNKNLSRRCPRDRALIAQEIIKLSYCITVKMQRRMG